MFVTDRPESALTDLDSSKTVHIVLPMRPTELFNSYEIDTISRLGLGIDYITDFILNFWWMFSYDSPAYCKDAVLSEFESVLSQIYPNETELRTKFLAQRIDEVMTMLFRVFGSLGTYLRDLPVVHPGYVLDTAVLAPLGHNSSLVEFRLETEGHDAV